MFDHVSASYVWAHDLVTLHYSDDDTDYPLRFQLWQPVDLAKLEQGLRGAHVPLKASKEALKETPPEVARLPVGRLATPPETAARALRPV